MGCDAFAPRPSHRCSFPGRLLLVLVAALMFFEVGQDLFLLLDLAGVVLRFLVGHLDLELVVVEFLLLPLDFNAEVDVLLFQPDPLVFDFLADDLLLLRLLVSQDAHPCTRAQPVDELLALLGEHLQFHLFVDLDPVEVVLEVVVVELRHFKLLVHDNIISMQRSTSFCK